MSPDASLVVSDCCNRRILIIDDNSAIHDDYKKTLVKRQESSDLDALEALLFDHQIEAPIVEFELTSAFQGKEGLEAVCRSLEERRPFALAFVDMRMPPGWDGLETIKRIWEVDPHLQIVISSAYSDHTWNELVDALDKNGQWLLLRKPFDSAEVSQLALALTHKWELERQSRERMQDLELAVERRTAELRREMQERLATQESLNSSNAISRAVLESARDGIVLFSSSGTVERANPAACRLFKRTADKLYGHPVTDLLRSEAHKEGRADSPQAFIERLAARQTGSDVERWQAQRPDGTYVPVSVAASEFQIGEGRGFAAILHDLSESERMQRELLQAQKLTAVGQLAAGVAHEINSPIQFVNDNTHYLRDSFAAVEKLLATLEECPSSIQRMLAEIPLAIDESLEGIERIKGIVGAMRELSGPCSTARSIVDLNHLVERSILITTSEWKDAAVVDAQLDPALPSIVGSPNCLHHAIVNLLINAAQAIRQKNASRPGELGTITVETRGDEEAVELSISDTGEGIPKEIEDRVFESFFTTKEVGEGSGQGLAIAWSTVVDRHGGELWFTRNPGGGTTFHLRLPLLQEITEEGTSPVQGATV